MTAQKRFYYLDQLKEVPRFLAVIYAALLIAAQPAFAADANRFPSQFADSYLDGCVNRGRQHGDDEAYVKYFCNCTLRILEEKYSFDEFQRLDEYRRRGKTPQDDKKFKEVLKEMERCKTQIPGKK